MPVDASIPLSVNPTGVDIKGMLSLADMAQQVRASQQKSQAQNMLKQLFTQPGALDANGNPSPQVIQQTMAIDPETGMALRQSTLESQVKKAQADHAKTEAGSARWGFLSSAAGVATDAYNAAKEAGKSDQDAVSAATAARNEAIKNNGGILGEQDATSAMASPFDPASAKIFALTNSDYAKRAHEAKTEDIAERREDASERRTDAMIGAIGAREGQAAKKGWDVRQDKDGTEYRYNVDTGEATTLDKKPYEIKGGAGKVGAAPKEGEVAFTPRSGSLMATFAQEGVNLPAGLRSKDQMARTFQGLIDNNPGKSDEEIAEMVKKGQIEFGAQKKETQVAAGIAGKVQVFANELDKNLPLLRKASAAVPRGNWMDLTTLLQTEDRHLSDPNLKELKGRINATLNAYDALAARGGTDAVKRAENRATLLSADGPEAFERQLKVFESEAQIAKESAYEATKSPELPGSDDKKGGTTVDHSKMSDEDLKKALGIP